MSHHEITHEVECKTYAALYHTAWHLLDLAEQSAEGSLLNLQAATVFFAFTFEAYLNHVGVEEIKFWDEIERISHVDKLTVLSKHLCFAKDQSRRPLQTMIALFKLRDALAHGRTQKLTIKKSSKSPPAQGSVWRLLPWESLTTDLVRRYRDDLRSAIELINSARPKPDKLVWNQGHRSTLVRLKASDSS